MIDARAVPADNGTVHIYGTVKRTNRELVPGAIVLLKYSYGGSAFQQFARLTTDSEGEFNTDWYTTQGTIIRCEVLGDTQYKTWEGGAYMYFAMTFRGGYKTP